MLNLLFKNENYNIKNPITILIVLFLLLVIIFSKQLYVWNLREGLKDFSATVEDSLDRYVLKYADKDDVNVITDHINYESTNLNIQDNEWTKLFLRDFYVKSSYNSCVLDSASKHLSEKTIPILLNRGVRFLDFQVFSLENTPVVGVGLEHNSTSISSSTYVPFTNVMNELITSLRNLSTTAPGSKTPLFIHIRMNTIMVNTVSELARIIKDSRMELLNPIDTIYMKTALLFPPYEAIFTKRYAYYRGDKKKPVTRGREKVDDLCKTESTLIIPKTESLGDLDARLFASPRPHPRADRPIYFIFDMDDEIYYNSDLANMMECYNYKEANFQKISTEELRNTALGNTITNFNKKGFTMVYPVFSGKYVENTTFPIRDGVECPEDENIPCYHRAMRLGCQFMPMAYNESMETDINYETSILSYDTMFNQMQSSYILKDSELRYIPETVKVIDGEDQPPEEGWDTYEKRGRWCTGGMPDMPDEWFKRKGLKRFTY